MRFTSQFLYVMFVLLSLQVSNVAQANDPDLSITPVFGLFPHVILGTDSPPVTFKIRNNHPSNDLTLGKANLIGTHASEFSLGTQNCEFQTLSPDEECTIDVIYHPTSFGSKMAMLDFSTNATNTLKLNAFLSNDEDTGKEAERRLPPVLFSLNIPETMDRSTTYNLDWSILGYHDSYESVIALFDCTGKAPGTCGANFADNFANSGLITASSTTPQPTWTFNGEQAVEHHYTYSFNANTEAFPQVTLGNHEIVVRFYRKNNMDVMSGEASLSLLVPGSLTNVYYDNEGRRISKIINVP